MLAIPFALPRTFGKMVGDNRQGYAILAVMAAIFLVSLTALTLARASGRARRRSSRAARWRARRTASASSGSTLFAGATTLDLDRCRQLDARLATRRSAA